MYCANALNHNTALVLKQADGHVTQQATEMNHPLN